MVPRWQSGKKDSSTEYIHRNPLTDLASVAVIVRIFPSLLPFSRLILSSDAQGEIARYLSSLSLHRFRQGAKASLPMPCRLCRALVGYIQCLYSV